MCDALAVLKKSVDDGVRSKAIQVVPHLILTETNFYFQRMWDSLAEWLIIWLQSKGISGLKEEDCLRYFKAGRPKDRLNVSTDEFIVPLPPHLPSSVTKLLNLCRIWLNSLFPHVLSKTNRVTYGLLPQRHFPSPLSPSPSLSDGDRFSSKVKCEF